jgi:hypothetical protein
VPVKDAVVPALSRVAELCLKYGIGQLQASQGTRNIWGECHSYGVWAGYRLNPRLAVGGIGEFIRFTPDVDQLMRLHYSGNFQQARVESDGGMLDILFAAPAVKLNFSLEDGPVMPYFLAGLGVLNRSMDPTSLTALDLSGATVNVNVLGYSSTGLGGTVGLGIPIRLREHLQLTVDARETAGFTSPEKTALHHLGFGLLYLW